MTETAIAEQGNLPECWCCGQRLPDRSMVHLGDHPEVTVCLACAHFLHQQARGREDEGVSSPAVRFRDAVRSVRAVVVTQRWGQNRYIGPALRWINRRLP